MRAFILVGLTFFIGALAAVLQPAAAQAINSGWLSADPELVKYREFDQNTDAPEGTRHDCIKKDVYAARVGYPGQFEELSLCVSYGQNFRFAQGSGYGYSYISIGSDQYFYRLDVSPGSAYLYHLVGTDTVIFAQHGADEGKHVTSYENLHTRLTLHPNQQYEVTNRETDSRLTGGVAGQYVLGWGISGNGRYFVYGRGPNVSQNSDVDYFVLVDTETQQKKLFGKGFYLHYHRPGSPPDFVVSNDGATVIATGYGTLKFWNITQECLIDIPDMLAFAPDPCENRIYYPDFYHDHVPYPDSNRLLVNDDFTHIEYIYLPTYYTVKLQIPGYVAPTRLDYLALGDSYSSGEGDISGKYYLPGTGAKGECHLSSRSYPFLLWDKWGLNESDMKSVACSGARVVLDYISSTGEYNGQNDRLHDYTEEDKLIEIDLALNGFKPGIVPQIEFIKKYKPKVVTLTGGGNDVGFGNVIKQCVLPNIGVSGMGITVNCSYVENQSLNKMLINSIRSQYVAMKGLLEDIKRASPDTKIYLIGYPKFIAEGIAACMIFHTGDIGPEEVSMINSMHEELNDVLWRAATDSGVAFIDIEDSLEGGKMCQGSEYVSGLVDVGLWNIVDNYVQESFHPNANGHRQMAKSIHDKIPSISHIVDPATRPNAKSGQEYKSSPITKMLNMINSVVERMSKQRVQLDAATLQSGTYVSIANYSDPVDLGTHLVNQDGSLDIEVILPESVTMGYHTLVIEGTSHNGEPITLYQHLTVTSGIDGDVDGDGIADEHDKCMFITKWIDEATGDDVCNPSNGGNANDTSSNKTVNKDSALPNAIRPLVYLSDAVAYDNTNPVRVDYNSNSFSDDGNIADSLPRPQTNNTSEQSNTESSESGISLLVILLTATTASLAGGLLYQRRRKYSVKKIK